MKHSILLGALLCAAAAGSAHAGIISAAHYADDAAFSAATGAVSLTGALPNLGNVGTSVTLGDATLESDDDLFVGAGWSSLLGNAIAISGPEHLGVTINTGLATAFGLYYHEPSNSEDRLDGCNTTCVESIFTIAFYLGDTLIDSIAVNPVNDQLMFGGIILDESFDRVRFTEAGGGDNEFYGEMYVARVPEPGSLALLGAGLLGLGVMRRRRG